MSSLTQRGCDGKHCKLYQLFHVTGRQQAFVAEREEKLLFQERFFLPFSVLFTLNKTRRKVTF